jgi:hypothetical protein
VLSASSGTRRSATRIAERTLATGLHLVGAPAFTDVRPLARSIANLEGRVRELTHELEDLRADLGRDQR